jgi:AcrR family transcriptional regulator
MRADARRNRDRLVAVAGEVVAEQGAEASLEEIARRAGVGSATLHRHFPSRLALLDAVFAERVAVLCDLGESLLAAPTPGDALVRWLGEVARHAVRNRGLATSLLKGTGESSHARILAAGQALVTRAQDTGAIRRDVSTGELLALVNGVALAAGEDEELADRLLTLAVEGLREMPGSGLA